MLLPSLTALPYSYATVYDLENLSLPNAGQPAYLDSQVILSPPFTTTGLTLKIQTDVDGFVQPEYTFTFTGNYATLDLLVAAISIPNVIAVNSAGRLRLRTIKTGIGQSITINENGTANSILGYNQFFDSTASGSSTISNDITDDEKNYALASATSIADGYLARRYTLPLKGWPFNLTQAVCDIAAYIILNRKGYNPEKYDNNWKLKNDAAIQWLSDVGNRKIHPIMDVGHKPVPTVGTGYGPEWSDPRGWGISSGIDCGRGWGCGGCGSGFVRGWYY